MNYSVNTKSIIFETNNSVVKTNQSFDDRNFEKILANKKKEIFENLKKDEAKNKASTN